MSQLSDIEWLSKHCKRRFNPDELHDFVERVGIKVDGFADDRATEKARREALKELKL